MRIPTLILSFMVLSTLFSACAKKHKPVECKKVCEVWGMTPQQRTDKFGEAQVPEEYRWGHDYEAAGLSAFKGCAERADKKGKTPIENACYDSFLWACSKACKEDLE